MSNLRKPYRKRRWTNRWRNKNPTIRSNKDKSMVERFIKENLISQGMIVDYAIHDESQDKNG